MSLQARKTCVHFAHSPTCLVPRQVMPRRCGRERLLDHAMRDSPWASKGARRSCITHPTAGHGGPTSGHYPAAEGSLPICPRVTSRFLPRPRLKSPPRNSPDRSTKPWHDSGLRPISTEVSLGITVRFRASPADKVTLVRYSASAVHAHSHARHRRAWPTTQIDKGSRSAASRWFFEPPTSDCGARPQSCQPRSYYTSQPHYADHSCHWPSPIIATAPYRGVASKLACSYGGGFAPSTEHRSYP